MSTGTQLQLVWFKRDLRVADHAPLAVRRGGVVALLEKLRAGVAGRRRTGRKTSAREPRETPPEELELNLGV